MNVGHTMRGMLGRCGSCHMGNPCSMFFLEYQFRGCMLCSMHAWYFNTLGEDNIFLTRPENIATRDDIGFEVSLNYSPAKWLDVTWSGNIYQGKLDAENLGFLRQTEFFSYTSRLNTKLTLPKDMDVQIMLSYRGAEDTPQGQRKSVLYTDLGISKDVLKKKATVSVRISDIFNTAWYRYENATALRDPRGLLEQRCGRWTLGDEVEATVVIDGDDDRNRSSVVFFGSFVECLDKLTQVHTVLTE